MVLPIYQIDAFSDKPFSGKPASVFPLPQWLDDSRLQNIALENNLSETPFFVKNKQYYEIRWFTPTTEVALCGYTRCRGLIATDPSESADFVSRFFAPQIGVPEEPVSGSAHTCLVPHWTQKTSKKGVLCQATFSTWRRTLL